MTNTGRGHDRAATWRVRPRANILALRLLADVSAGVVAIAAMNSSAWADCVQTGNTLACSGTSLSNGAPLAKVVSDGRITVEGSATASGSASSAILGSGDQTSLTNNGNLATDGAFADVMEIVGNNGSIVNRGSVSSRGASADALRAVGGGNVLTNAGTVITAGDSARGLYVEGGGGNTLTNTGGIATTGSGSDGMRAKADGSTIVNRGAIATSGDIGNGVRATGSSNTVVNEGTIATSGNEARGIKIDAGTGNVVTNRGSIRTTGATDAHGIWVASSAGQTTDLVNEASGAIESQSVKALRFGEGDERFENFGRITAASGGMAGDLGGGSDSFLIGAFSRIDGFIDAANGTDSFALGGAADAAFDAARIGPAAQYRNFEAYEKVGTSTWTVTGTNNASMPWAIREGTLMVAGAMGGSDMVVHSGATLGGSGTVGSIDARSGSTLTPGVNGIGVLTVMGNVLIADGTIYRIDLNAGLQSDRILANGAATVRGGSVRVEALPGDYRPGSRWTILTANGGVTGQFSGVTTSLAFFRPRLAKDGNNIYLELPRIVPRSFPTDRPIIDPYTPVTEEELPRVLDLTSGEALVDATGVILAHDDLFRVAVLCRLRCSMGGLPAIASLDGPSAGGAVQKPLGGNTAVGPGGVGQPRQDSDWIVWGKGIGSWGSTDATARTAGVDRTTGGVVFGIDSGFGTPYRIGLAGGYFSTNFDVASLSSSGTVESVHIGAYGAASFGAFNLRGGVAYAHHEVDMKRAISFTGFSGTNLTGGSTESFQAFGEIGYAIALGRVTLEPFVGLAHVHVDSRGVLEEGSAVAVMGQAHSFDVPYSTLGAQLVTTIPTDAGTLTFKGMLGWRHVVGDTVPRATFSYVSGTSPFLVSGAPIDKDSLVAEASLNWAMTDKVTLGIAYGGVIGARDREHTLRGSLSIRF